MAKAEEIKFSGTKAAVVQEEKDAQGNVISSTEISPATKFSGTVSFNMPETIEEAIQMWGGEVVLNKAQQAVIIDLQRIARSADGDLEKAQSAVNSFVPGVTRRDTTGVSMKALMEALKNLDPETRKAILAQAGIPQA